MLVFTECLCQSTKLILTYNYLCCQIFLHMYEDYPYHLRFMLIYNYLWYSMELMISHELFCYKIKSKVYTCHTMIFTLDFKKWIYQTTKSMLNSYYAKNYFKTYLCHSTEFMIFCSLNYRYVNKAKNLYVLKKNLAWSFLDISMNLYLKSLKNFIPKNDFNMFYLEAFMKRPALAIVKIFNNLK